MSKRKQTPLILVATLLATAGTLLLLKIPSGPPHLVHADPGTRYVSATDSTCGGKIPCHSTAQAAVGAASPGDEILIATGNYTDTNSSGGHIQALYVNKSVTIRGGYSTDFSDWNPQAYPTTLDARELGRVVYITGDITPTLEGLQLTNGSISAANGGGVYIKDSHATINACDIYSNTADWSGGGIAINGSAGVTLTNNWIHRNKSNGGGGIGIDSSNDITLIGNQVYSNVALLIEGGGVHLYKSDNITLTDNHIHNNTAQTRGGGIYLDSGDNATLTQNEVYSNTAFSYGGGLFIDSAEVTLEGNTIQNNSAGSEAGMGIEQSTVTLINNIVADNIKMGFPCAAGILIQDSAATLIHNTIAHNRGGVPGSGVYVTGSSIVTLTNNILVSHTVGITVAAGSTATLKATLWGEGAWANETAWGGSGHIVSATNVIGAPDFVNPDDGDYHISSNSVAIDQGIVAGVTTDVDGDPRMGVPDIGADEFIIPVYLPLVLKN